MIERTLLRSCFSARHVICYKAVRNVLRTGKMFCALPLAF